MTARSLLLSPAAERNKGPILDVLRVVLPASGCVLEIASGTGQHVAHFAAALPGLEWQPSEANPAARDVLAAHLADVRLPNVRAPVVFNVADCCGSPVGPVAAMLCINMIHIAPYLATAQLFFRANVLLDPGGVIVLYGPFREDGRHTAPSNEAFDASLRERNPEWGVRDLEDVTYIAEMAGLARTRVERLPANNLAVVFEARGAKNG